MTNWRRRQASVFQTMYRTKFAVAASQTASLNAGTEDEGKSGVTRAVNQLMFWGTYWTIFDAVNRAVYAHWRMEGAP